MEALLGLKIAGDFEELLFFEVLLSGEFSLAEDSARSGVLHGLGVLVIIIGHILDSDYWR